MKKLIAILLLATAVQAQDIPPGCDAAQPQWAIVYTRQARHQTKIEATGPGEWTIDDASNFQHVNDISRVWQQSESDVVLDDLQGHTKVIHACSTTAKICTAQEASSSLDGKQIIYSVSTAPDNATKWPVRAANGPITPLWDFDTKTAELWLYDIPTDTSRRLTTGSIDRQPKFASKDLIVFACDRSKTFARRSTGGLNYYPHPDVKNRVPGYALHICRGRITAEGLTDIADITPAEDFAQSPEVLTDGNIAYSSYQGTAPREFGSTPQNHWWVCLVDINGNNPRCLLGSHGSGTITNRALLTNVDPARTGESSTTLKGLRPVAEIYTDFLATSNYYRGNSTGAMGKIIGWPYVTDGAEGSLYEASVPALDKWANAAKAGSGRYTPSGLLNMTPVGTDQDAISPVFDKSGKSYGRFGYPRPLPGDGDDYLATWCRGWCYEATPPGMATYAAMGGEPPAKKTIVRIKVRQLTNPFDPNQMEVIACSGLDRHCWEADAITDYKSKFGIDAPKLAPIVTPTTCELRVVNARAGELFPIPGGNAQSRVTFQGNAVDNYPAVVTAFGIEPFDQWTRYPDKEGAIQTYPPIKADLMPDGSVKLPVPCAKPFLHFGYDKDGNKVASGLMPMAATGVMHCHGCHDGHSEERAKVLGRPAKYRFWRGGPDGKPVQAAGC